MKIVAAMIIAGCLATPALAAAGEAAGTGPGHSVWKSDPIIGPKSSPPTRHHIWVPDRPVAAAGEGSGQWQWLSKLSVGPRGEAMIRRRVRVSDQ